MEWFDIEEVKPKHGQAVLVTNGEIVTAARIDCDTFGPEEIWLDAHGFSGYEWEYNFDGRDVTHWAELPQPPRNK